ncbi:LysR family transcriptional regulator [Photobacterium kagoshimensis]|uniref:LysR family transcriptional regulator n=1 Tax=Photobacterium kagoshimensis TaxID=2910242 RepID=UPI003D0D77B0
MQKVDNEMLTPVQLRAFLAVVDSGSMNKAAKLLKCSQSTISRLIDQMEDQTGIVLFKRSFSSKRIQLTAQGETVLQRSRHTVKTFDDLNTFCLGLSMGVETEMRVALPPIFTQEDMQYFIRALVNTFPTTRFSLLEPSLFQIHDKVQAGEVDFAVNVFIAAKEEGISSIGLGSIEACFVSHVDHPLAKMDRVSFADLEMGCQVTYLMPEPPSLKTELNFSNTILEVETTEQMLLLTSCRLGYALIPKIFLEKAEQQYDLVRLNTDLDQRLIFPIHATFLEVNHNRPINRWICDYLHQQLLKGGN